MPAPALNDKQRDEVLQRIAAGEPYPDIAAAMGCPLNSVKYLAGKKRSLVQQVREKFAPQFATERAARDAEAEARIAAPILAELREEEGRTDALVWLASEMHHILATEGFYATDIRMNAKGDTVEVPAFRNAEVTQFRAALDDVAKERGARKSKVEHSGHLTYEVEGVNLDAV